MLCVCMFVVAETAAAYRIGMYLVSSTFVLQLESMYRPYV